jgi:hypothetical protein
MAVYHIQWDRKGKEKEKWEWTTQDYTFRYSLAGPCKKWLEW